MNDPDPPARSRPTRDRAQPGRTGAGTAPARPRPAADPSGGEKVARTTYRGVRWERNAAGRLRWHNDDDDRWVLWRPGQDAPPLPPGWAREAEPLGTPLRDRRARKGWRSPYRLAPVVLILVVTIIAIIQASQGNAPGPNPAAVEKAAAEKLLDKCLVAHGAGGQQRFEAQPVACT
ncbi:MAG: hypothetical protein J2O47_06995, partial [Acidimicrobiaceae bacterium]|nr:hypothetical protein [Acidimicrobiaceae bacterium]